MNIAANGASCPYRMDLTASDVHGEHDVLRSRGAGALVELPGEVRAWAVTDPALIRWITTHPQVSRSARLHWPAYVAGAVPDDWPLRNFADATNALSSHGAEHRRLRAPLADWFSRRRVSALDAHIQETAGHLLDQLGTADPHEVVDLRARFAWVVPLAVLNTILGVPDELADALRTAVDGSFTTSDTAAALAARADLHRLLGEVVAIRRARPGEDLTSDLITACDAGTLTPQELTDSLLMIIAAAHETTVNLLGSGIASLLTHPRQLALLRAGAHPWEEAVEEILRHEAPVSSLPMRYAMADLDHPLLQTPIREGELILLAFGAAGRDPGQHEDPGAFDITREAHDHLAFGHGTHFCLGARVARRTGALALELLFERFPRLALAVPVEELESLPSFISNGPRALPALLYGAARP